MDSSPEIFVSAAGADLDTCRELIRTWVMEQAAIPVSIEDYPASAAEALALLREKMASCAAVVCVAGKCYGAEPSIPLEGQPPRSFAQMEYDVARSLRRRIVAFRCHEQFPFDPHLPESAEYQSRQEAHRRGLRSSAEVRRPEEILARLAKVRLPVAAGLPSSAVTSSRPARTPANPAAARSMRTVAITAAVLAAILIAGGAGAFAWTRWQGYGLARFEQERLAKEAQAAMETARPMLLDVADTCALDQDFGRPAPVEDRIAAAFNIVARRTQTPVEELPRQAARYVAVVRATAAAAPLDRALADWVDRKFDSAATQAAIAARAFAELASAEETASDAARRTAERPSSALKVMVTARAESAAAGERARVAHEQQGRAWALAGQAGALGKEGREAAAAYENALAQADETKEPLRRADLLQCLAGVHFERGFSEETESALRKAIALRTGAVGPYQPATVRALQNLATLFYARHDAAAVGPILQQVIEAQEHLLGPDDPETLDTVAKLAGWCVSSGDNAGAEPLYRRVVAVQEKSLPPDAPLLLSNLNNLATALTGKGDYQGAEPLYRRVLAGRELALGPDHASTLVALSNLAALLSNKGDYAGADPLFRRLIEARERMLGPGDPSALASVNALVYMLRTKGDPRGAEAVLQQALERQEQALGPTHAITLQTVARLADQFMREKNWAAAEPLFRRLVEAREQQLGPENSETLQALKGLAYVLQGKGAAAAAPDKPPRTGDNPAAAEAEAICRRILAAQEKTLGPGSAETLGTVQNLANLLLVAGRDAEAEPLLERALPAREKLLGRNHPDTALTAYVLGSLRRKQGRYREALILAREAAEGMKATLPPTDPQRLAGERLLAFAEAELAAREKKPTFP